jgi:hypothetical protein
LFYAGAGVLVFLSIGTYLSTEVPVRAEYQPALFRSVGTFLKNLWTGGKCERKRKPGERKDQNGTYRKMKM